MADQLHELFERFKNLLHHDPRLGLTSRQRESHADQRGVAP